jgi:hypothetical protein
MSRTSSSRRIAMVAALLVIAAGGAVLFLPRGVAAAVSACRGANQVMVAPYSCTATTEIDGTQFTVVVDVSASGALTVTYTLDAPRDVPTDLRVRSHEGRASDDPAEAATVLAPGATDAVLTVGTILCGQIDVKAVFTGNGDARGRIAAPYVTTADECQPVTTTTTTTMPATTPPTVPPSSAPASVAAETTAWVTTVAGVQALPATGRASTPLAVLGVSAAVAGSLVLLTAGRRRPARATTSV